MTLNSFFLQGSNNEQFLIQDLINEQLRIYGIEVYYLPRKIFKSDDIIREVQASKFDDSFLIEAYLNNYEGYAPGVDIMSKFGINLKNEVNLTISRERFEEFISPFLEGITSGIRDGLITDYTFGDLISRPKEGDLIYFPLGERLFEIKHVEFERPFYQLGKNYIYELSCELYEYENELINTSIEEVDGTVDTEGYITTINLVGLGITALATATISNSYVKEIFLNNDGSGYTSTPIVSISPPESGIPATAVAITTSVSGVRSIEKIVLTNAGSGYLTTPTISITGGGGSGAAATCSIGSTTTFGVSAITINNAGSGYAVAPQVIISPPAGIGETASAIAFIDANSEISEIKIVNAGFGYTEAPTIGFSSLPNTISETYVYNEIVTGSVSGAQARVRNFTKTIRTDISVVNPPVDVELQVAINSGKFYPGEVLVGSISSSRYIIESYDTNSYEDPYDSNEQIQIEANSILDFSESNPFGEY
jgi:hypothetical protein